MTIMAFIRECLTTAFGTDERTKQEGARQRVNAGLRDAQQGVRELHAATARLSRFEPARSVDEALQQLTGRE